MRPNWIRARIACRADMILQCIADEMAKDIEEANKSTKHLTPGCIYNMEQSRDKITVSCQSDWEDRAFQASLQAMPDTDLIVVETTGPGRVTRRYDITVDWNPKQETNGI